VQHHDWLPTILAIAGDTGVVDKLKKGATVNGKKFKNHIDGYNLLPYLTGEEKESPRKLFFYFSDDGDVMGIRYDNWKLAFMEQRLTGTMQLWAEPFVRLRMPKVFNLRMDPYERADFTSNSYWDWCLHNMYFLYAAQAAAAKFVETFKEFPPVQKPGSFTIDDAMAKMSEVAGSS
jgi:arylsulfatase A-like enzyme